MPKEYVTNHFSRLDDKINECFEVLTSGEPSAPDVYVNAYCYLCYRAREEKFKDFNFLLSQIESAENKLKVITDKYAQARWKSSLITAYTYLYIHVKGMDNHLLAHIEKGVSAELVSLWPRIMTNVVMLGLLSIAQNIKTKNNSKANEVLLDIFSIYKTAIAGSTIATTHMSHNIIYELKDTTTLLSACVILGKLSNFSLNYRGLDDPKKELRNFLRVTGPMHSSVFYKAFPELEYKG